MQDKVWQVIAGLLTAAIVAIASTVFQNSAAISANSTRISVNQARVNRLALDVEKNYADIQFLEYLFYWGEYPQLEFYPKRVIKQ